MSISNYFCRKATLDDDFDQIAKYIHLTDPYIYPKISQNPGDKSWIHFIAQCLKKQNNIFYIKNISVVTCDSDIVGIACIIPCQKKLTLTKEIKLPLNLSQKIEPVIEGYFNPLIEESYVYNGYNIINVCIDEKHRGKGLGGLLLSYCIGEYGAQPIHLDVIASNASAVHLYQKYGFQIEREYMGYSGDNTQLPCFHMIRQPGQNN